MKIPALLACVCTWCCNLPFPLLQFLHKLTQANLPLEANENVSTINFQILKADPSLVIILNSNYLSCICFQLSQCLVFSLKVSQSLAPNMFTFTIFRYQYFSLSVHNIVRGCFYEMFCAPPTPISPISCSSVLSILLILTKSYHRRHRHHHQHHHHHHHHHHHKKIVYAIISMFG